MNFSDYQDYDDEFEPDDEDAIRNRVEKYIKEYLVIKVDDQDILAEKPKEKVKLAKKEILESEETEDEEGRIEVQSWQQDLDDIFKIEYQGIVDKFKNDEEKMNNNVQQLMKIPENFKQSYREDSDDESFDLDDEFEGKLRKILMEMNVKKYSARQKRQLQETRQKIKKILTDIDISTNTSQSDEEILNRESTEYIKLCDEILGTKKLLNKLKAAKEKRRDNKIIIHKNILQFINHTKQIEMNEKFKKTNNLAYNEFRIILQDTDIIELLTIPSSVAFESSPDFDRVNKNNEHYEKHQGAKKNNIKLYDNHKKCQTIKIIKADKANQTILCEKKDSFCMASGWDYHDSVIANNSLEKENDNKNKFIKNLDNLLIGLIKNEKKPSKLEKLFTKNISFKLKSLITRRIIASNLYSEQQRLFFQSCEGTKPPFSFAIKKLWMYNDVSVKKLGQVTTMSWNRMNNTILAVGYGHMNKYNKPGGVACWSLKCPLIPEKIYFTDGAVTQVEFSHTWPALLAVSTISGYLLLYDISNSNIVFVNPKSIDIINEIDLECKTSVPIYSLKWYRQTQSSTEKERILITGPSGEVIRWEIEDDLSSKTVMTLHRLPFPLHEKEDVCYDRFTGISLASQEPYTYLIGTLEGAIIWCELKNFENPKKTFPAHKGAVNSLEFSPFCQVVFISCGSDGFIKLWILGLEEAVVVQQVYQDWEMISVNDIKWSPLHPCIFISATDNNFIQIWNLTNKYLIKENEIEEDNVTFLKIKFCSAGNNIIAGTKCGKIIFYHLNNMPPTYQDKLSYFTKTLLEYLTDQIEKKNIVESILNDIYYTFD